MATDSRWSAGVSGWLRKQLAGARERRREATTRQLQLQPANQRSGEGRRRRRTLRKDQTCMRRMRAARRILSARGCLIGPPQGPARRASSSCSLTPLHSAVPASASQSTAHFPTPFDRAVMCFAARAQLRLFSAVAVATSRGQKKRTKRKRKGTAVARVVSLAIESSMLVRCGGERCACADDAHAVGRAVCTASAVAAEVRWRLAL